MQVWRSSISTLFDWGGVTPQYFYVLGEIIQAPLSFILNYNNHTAVPYCVCHTAVPGYCLPGASRIFQIYMYSSVYTHGYGVPDMLHIRIVLNLVLNLVLNI